VNPAGHAEGARSGVAGLVLAAGAATRFGGPKQLAELDGMPMLEHSLRAMAAAPVDRVVVVLGAAADEIVAGVQLHGAAPLVCPRWEKGQAASLACGLAELADAEAVVVTLGDQPRMAPEAISRVIGRRNGAAAVRATYGGVPGHPVLLESELFERLRNVTGDLGARNLLLSVQVHDVPCDDLGGGEDVDTPVELDALRAGGPVTGTTAR
jgi:CTP:molybdopterin cytidylyltransferase MocA